MKLRVDRISGLITRWNVLCSQLTGFSRQVGWRGHLMASRLAKLKSCERTPAQKRKKHIPHSTCVLQEYKPDKWKSRSLVETVINQSCLPTALHSCRLPNTYVGYTTYLSVAQHIFRLHSAFGGYITHSSDAQHIWRFHHTVGGYAALLSVTQYNLLEL